MNEQPMIKIKYCKELVDTAKEAYSLGMFAGTSGNLSYFDSEEGVMYITPTSVPYDKLSSDMVSCIDNNTGNLLSGKEPSSEAPMHSIIYRELPHIHSIVHTHSPYATGIAVNNGEIPIILIEMVYFLKNTVKTAPFAIPGSIELGKLACPFLRESNSVLLANHGVVSIGDSLEQALLRAVYTEDAAKIYTLAKSTGEPKIISDELIKSMLEG